MSQKSPYQASPDVSESKIDYRWQSSSPALYTASDDPRSSSAQSLIPSPSEQNDSGRRTLLVIYIHGFMGNDSSFQSFPAHVHRYLKLALVDTHVIHTKIYPRYKTYKTLDVARDNFSRWLAPHESPTTDVVLLGHSMGGMLAADIALMPSRDQYRIGYFLHRILGTVHLDVPLLGLHPGIITAGIASLFRSKPDKPDQATAPEDPIPEDESAAPISNVTSASASIYSDPSSASIFSSQSSSSPGIRGPHGITFDPNFNPAFPNDVRFQDRGWWRNIVHFVEKHSSEGIVDAATNHIMSHLEFGGCLLDGNGLKTRYENIRKLEDVDDIKHHGFPHVPPRVRFTQYYTVCHGYPKAQNSKNRPETPEMPNSPRSAPLTPQASFQDHKSPSRKSNLTNGASDEDYFSADGEESPGLQLLDPEPIPEEPEPMEKPDISHQPSEDSKGKSLESGLVDVKPSDSGDNENSNPQQNQENHLSKESSGDDRAKTTELSDAIATLALDLPAIPELPNEPEPPNLEQYKDKDTRKQVEKEAKRAQKDYAKLVKERDRTIKERQKIFDKRKKKLAQETEKREKEEQKRRKKEEAMAAAQSVSNLEEQTSKDGLDSLTLEESGGSYHDVALEQSQSKTKPPKPPKERKFCNTPPKVDGQMDSKWIKIFMKDTDQVGAHTGLFFKGEHYERLVGDVGETIVNWVQDDMTKRAILEMD
ncbi:hypothetical protein F4805DRAFT_452820 [Annulohypoxylon moriforme]|nr:hypothetical protein F4805DRAFT_452820 [Annulohypoxylon moriforme]